MAKHKHIIYFVSVFVFVVVFGFMFLSKIQLNTTGELIKGFQDHAASYELDRKYLNRQNTIPRFLQKRLFQVFFPEIHQFFRGQASLSCTK